MSGRADEEGQALSKPEYWDERYHTSDGSKPTHEWFKSFDALRPLFESHLAIRSIDSRIVHLGSGDSTIPNDLAILGYRNQLCVDFSSAVVQLMAPNAKDGVEWMQGDVRDLDQIPCGSVDAAFDKGTLDAMIYGSPWNPPDDVKQNASQYMEEVHRILKDNGVFLYITFRQPHFIKPLVNDDGIWDLEVQVLRDGDSSFDYHAFIMKKANSQHSRS